MRSEHEIKEQMYDAQDWTVAGETDVRSMTYEEGVEAALRWALGDSDDEPIENKYGEEEDEEEFEDEGDEF